MKSLRIAAVLISFLLIIPASGFALVDAGIYGGYSFAGKLDLGPQNPNTYGWEYGAIAHLNTSIVSIFNVGIGGFLQQTPLKYSSGGSHFDCTKTDFALDAFIMLDLPVLPVHPFLRGGVGLYETIRLENPAGTSTEHKSFNSYHFGLGVAWSVIPYVQVYGEYLYNTSKQANDVKITGNSLHAGVRLFI